MRNIIKSLILIILAAAGAHTYAHAHRDTLYNRWHGRFTENLGQWSSPELFRTTCGGATLFVERDRFTFLLEHPDNLEMKHRHGHNLSGRYRTHAYQMLFVGGSADTLYGIEQQEGYENFYLGRDASRWRSGVRSYGAVRYGGLYPGIDLSLHNGEEGLKYDLILAPEADPQRIRLRFVGTEGLRLRDGNLVVRTSVSDVIEMQPIAYQEIDGKRVPVEAAFRLQGDEVTFSLGGYDRRHALVIDPQLYFSTYTGSQADNWGTTAAYDQQKNVYTAGVVFGSGYPVSLGAYDGSFNGNADVGIFVFNPTGTQRIYATYLGGLRADMPHTMVVNDLNELVIFGTTGSADFPVTPDAYDTSFNGGSYIDYESNAISYPNGSDIFVCRFAEGGSALAASTYVGGTGNDGLNYKHRFNSSMSLYMLGNDSIYANYGDGARGELICDDLANIYIGSTTNSADFPVTAGAFCTQHAGGQDGVVFKLDYNLQHLLWSGYLGGSSDDAVYSIDVDDQYNLVVCGGTCSRDLPTTPDALHPIYLGGTADGFVAKIDYYGRTLMACSYIGSYAYDQAYFARCGKHNDVFLFGQTKASGTTLVRNATFSNPGSGQFLMRLSPDLDSLHWSTVFGSGRNTPDISPTAFAADICDRVYAVGWGRYFCGYGLAGNYGFFDPIGTTGMPVTTDAYQATTDAQDFYIFSMSSDASAQTYGSFFGERHTGSGFYGGHDHVDGGTSRFDRTATLYQSVCASCGGTDDFPTTQGAWSQANEATNCNNAVFRFNVASDFPVADFPNHSSICANSPLPVIFPFTGRGDSVVWDYGDGTSDNGRPSDHAGQHHYTHPGIYTVRAIAYMDTGCRTSDTLVRQLLVLGDTSYRLDTLSTCHNAPVQIGLLPALNTEYQWIQGRVSDPRISNPYTSTAGEYIMVMRSSDGCVDTVRQYVAYGVASIALLGDTVTCSSPAHYWVESASDELSYQWYTSSDRSRPVGRGATLDLELDSSLTLYCHVSDRLGCEGDDSLRIRFYRIMDSLDPHDPHCPDACDGSVSVLLTSAATPPYSYTYDGTASSDSIATGLCAGDHTTLLTDANGCHVEKRFTLTSPPPPDIQATLQHIRCIHDHSGAITLDITGTHPPYTLLWADNGSTSPTRSSLDPGVYPVDITDSEGCLFHQEYEILDAPDNFADITVWADDSVLFLDQSTHLHADGCPTCSYLWSPTEPLDNATFQSPIATLQDTTIFYVTLSDPAGCTYTDSVRVCCIYLDCGTSSLFIPNAFTPNGDGLNDQLCLRSEWVTAFELRIFSRWGEQVYESHDVNACWDGTYHGQPCMPGVYTYYCKISCEAGQEAVFKGDITLIR